MKKLDFARCYAQYRHRDQKWGDKPYIHHLDQVLAYVIETGCGDEDVLVASVLHDVEEDSNLNLNTELFYLFGADVERLVFRCSSVSKENIILKPRAKRQGFSIDWEMTLNRIIQDPRSALIKFCDRYHNTFGGDDRCYIKYKNQYPLFKEKLQPILSQSNSVINSMWNDFDNRYL